MKTTIKFLKGAGVYAFFHGAKNVGSSNTADLNAAVKMAQKQFPKTAIVINGGLQMTHDEYRAKRVQLGYTQEQLAEALGVARGTVNRRESGTLPITPEAALALEALPYAKRKQA